MTGRTIRLISLCATFWIARSLRHIRRRTSVAESIGFLPRSDSLHQGIDLFVSEHSPCTLRERGHCSSAHTVGNDAANCGVVRNCEDRKSTRLNSSHSQISYAVFCLKKKT